MELNQEEIRKIIERNEDLEIQNIKLKSQMMKKSLTSGVKRTSRMEHKKKLLLEFIKETGGKVMNADVVNRFNKAEPSKDATGKQNINHMSRATIRRAVTQLAQEHKLIITPLTHSDEGKKNPRKFEYQIIRQK